MFGNEDDQEIAEHRRGSTASVPDMNIRRMHIGRIPHIGRVPVVGPMLLAAGLLLAACSSGGSASPATTGAGSSVTSTTATFGLEAAFTPGSAAVNGSTDVYHCSLIDPHLTTDRVLVASQFLPGATAEVHHAIYFLIPPDQAARARELNATGGGWGCFGAPLNPKGSFDNTVWLGGWAPGPAVVHRMPAGTGISMPAGSLVVMQIHYNLLAGDRPDNSRVKFVSVPAAGSHLKELQTTKYVAPPDLPCPAGITGPLCDRAASVADLSARTGQQAESFLGTIEKICAPYHDPANPLVQGDLVTTTCTWNVGQTMHLLFAAPHMHLLGASERITLLSGGKETSLANVAHYNFDDQHAQVVPSGLTARAGDQIRVTCTYDPTLRQKLPQLRSLPARFVTWGDGSSDEMCLGTVGWTAN